MHNLKNGQHGVGLRSVRLTYFTLLNSLFLVFLFNGQVLAQTCKVSSITASTPTADFVVNGDGTVTHTKTGLMWKICSEGMTWNATGTTCTGKAQSYTWQGALQQAQAMNGNKFAGYTDWRVPNIKELDSIMEYQCNFPSINATIFPATNSGLYWSASPYAIIPGFSLVASFDLGGDAYNSPTTIDNVRLVRGGQ